MKLSVKNSPVLRYTLQIGQRNHLISTPGITSSDCAVYV